MRELPNVGREGHTWMTYIVRTGVFAPTNVFLQGKPETSLATVAAHVRQHRERDTVSLMPLKPVSCHAEEYYDLPRFHAELERVRAYFLPKTTRCHFYRGEFIASGVALEHMRTRHGAFIEDALMPALETENDPPMGHALERMWIAFLARLEPT